MTNAKRWLLYAPIATLVVFLGLWALVWRAGEGIMRDRLAEFAATQASQGVDVEHGSLKTRGFPFFLRGEVPDFSIAKGADRYQCARLFIDALPYAPDRIIFSCGGDQRAWANGQEWLIRSEDGKASIERDKERGWMFKAESGAFVAESGPKKLSLTMAVVNVAPSLEDPATLQTSIRLVGAPASNPDADRLDVAATLSGPDPFGARLLTINGLEAISAGARLRGKGVFQIPANGAINGRIESEIENPAGVARTLEVAGVIDAVERARAEAGLGMLAVASGGVIRAPIEVSGGAIRIAGVELATFGKNQP
jgi:hypothetical protein